MNILIVDDIATNRKLLRVTLDDVSVTTSPQGLGPAVFL